MENHPDHAKVIAELRKALLDADKKQKIDWMQFDDENLLKCFAILFCWRLDGMIRICGVSGDILGTDNNPESWTDVIQDVNRRRITLNDLAQLYFDGVDFPAVLILAYLEWQYRRAGREILNRVELRPVGKQIVFWADRFPNFREENLLRVLKPPKTILARGKKIKLSDPFRNIPKDRKEMERQSLNFSAGWSFTRACKAHSSGNVRCPS